MVENCLSPLETSRTRCELGGLGWSPNEEIASAQDKPREVHTADDPGCSLWVGLVLRDGEDPADLVAVPTQIGSGCVADGAKGSVASKRKCNLQRHRLRSTCPDGVRAERGEVCRWLHQPK